MFHESDLRPSHKWTHDRIVARVSSVCKDDDAVNNVAAKRNEFRCWNIYFIAYHLSLSQ